MPQGGIFAGQLPSLETPLDGGHDLFHAEGLQQKVGCPAAQSGNGGFEIRIGGDEDHIHARAVVAQALYPFEP